MRFDILTLFPEMFPAYLGQSLLAKAIERRLIEVETHNIRDWSKDDKHHRVDDRPYGGGPGMVMMVEPVVECVEEVQKLDERAGHMVLLSPQGRRLEQCIAEELAGEERLLLLCGRYEGFDQRIIDILDPVEISIGDYVLEAVSRFLPGVLGDEDSSQTDSFSGEERLLEFPQYTRPREYRGHKVPEVLTSGDHQRIADWRKEQSLKRTKERRADLLD